MGLNIKNERVHAMAREASRRTGTNQTSVIELALSRLLEQLDAQEDDGARQGRVGELVTDMQRRVRRADRQLSADDLYDESGLPR